MKRLIDEFKLTMKAQLGLYHWVTNGKVIVLGKYDGDTFEGSDRLSMSVMTSNAEVKPKFEDKIVIAEGDRFTNSTFIKEFNPVIIRINGDGSEGRLKRGTNQSDRQIKSMTTRVKNTLANVTVNNYDEAFTLLKAELYQPTLVPTPPAGAQSDLF